MKQEGRCEAGGKKGEKVLFIIAQRRVGETGECRGRPHTCKPRLGIVSLEEGRVREALRNVAYALVLLMYFTAR